MMAGPQPHRRLNPSSRSAAAMEIEPGRRVPNRWDEYGPHLLERWAERSARLRRERALAAEAERQVAARAATASAADRRLVERIERDREFAAVRRKAEAQAHAAELGAATDRRVAWAGEPPTGFGARNG